MKASEAWSPDELLTRASAGESAAFAALVRRYQRTVYSIALRMLGDRHRAEDLAQEVFLQLYRSLDSIGSDTHLAFWLRKVAVNRAIDRMRQESRYDNEPLTEAASVADEIGDVDPLLQRHLAELVAQLPPAARAVVVLRYQEDLDPVDIASTLDMPINTVKSHLKRSLTSLRARVLGAAIVDDVQPSMSGPSR
ncbi:MAG TPA: sigma-70 family RNA polymerase sigma factor [Steroidobacteraceae bacterium]|nr:sigma-70 family RNA polymerase sigma factor [Steroidobacteraceae bacterium]